MKNIIWGVLILVTIYRFYQIFKESKTQKKQGWEDNNHTKIMYAQPSESHIFKPIYLAAHYSIISGLKVDQVLDTEINTPNEKASWKESWDVDDHESAIQSLEWLQNTGHRANLTKYVNLFNGQNWVNVTQKTKMLLPQLKNAKEKLGISGPLPTVGAWDYARLANNARIFHSFGYIAREEADHYLQAAFKLAKIEYPTWQAYSEGFIIGRLIWAEEFSDPFFELHQVLLSEKESPFIKSSFG